MEVLEIRACSLIAFGAMMHNVMIWLRPFPLLQSVGFGIGLFQLVLGMTLTAETDPFVRDKIRLVITTSIFAMSALIAPKCKKTDKYSYRYEIL